MKKQNNKIGYNEYYNKKQTALAEKWRSIMNEKDLILAEEFHEMILNRRKC